MLYLGNSFSLQMIDLAEVSAASFREVTPDYVRDKISAGFTSAVGHFETAAVLSKILGTEITRNRINITLSRRDTLIVAQLQGGRLPEGSTQLPDGVSFKFIEVKVGEPNCYSCGPSQAYIE